MQSRIEYKTTNGPLDRHEGPPLYGKLLVLTLVTETNNEACAQLQLALSPLTSHFSIPGWSMSIDCHKANCVGETSDLIKICV